MTGGVALAVVLAAATAVWLLTILDLDREYAAPLILIKGSAEDWYLHHDEKIIVADARHWYLHRTLYSSFEDYGPEAVSASFGIAGPLLAWLGFHVSGWGNRGLRFLYACSSLAVAVLVVTMLFRLCPQALATGFSFVFLFNFPNIVLHRHAILENLLTSQLLLTFWALASTDTLAWPVVLLAGGLLACVVLVKPNYCVYALLLICAWVAIAGRDTTRPLVLVLGFLVGLAAWEGLQAVVLLRAGLLRGRYVNLVRALRHHAGKDNRYLQQFRPVGPRVLARFVRQFAEWYGLSLRAIPERVDGWLALGTAATLGAVVLRGAGRTTWGPLGSVALFVLLYLSSCMPFHYYLKRAVSVFPLFLVLVAGALTLALPVGLVTSLDNWPATVALAACGVAAAGATWPPLQHWKGLRSRGVAQNSRRLDSFVPHGTTMFAHCYALRFFWQARHVRLMSFDDQIMDNQRIVDWAIENGGRYVLLSDRAGKLAAESRLLLRSLATFSTAGTDSDIVEHFELYEAV